MVHKIELPEKIRAWWFLRRSGLTRDQRQLTQLGDSNLTLDKAIKAMNFIIGQDSKVDGASSDGTKAQPPTRPMPTWQRMMKHGVMTRSTWSGMTMRLKVTRCWMVTRRTTMTRRMTPAPSTMPSTWTSTTMSLPATSTPRTISIGSVVAPSCPCRHVVVMSSSCRRHAVSL